MAVSDLDITFLMPLLHKHSTLYLLWRRSSALKKPGFIADLWHSSPADDVVTCVFNGMKLTMNENDCQVYSLNLIFQGDRSSTAF